MCMKTTINTLKKLKKSGEKIVCLTTYDASFASKMDRLGVELLLVGDSLGMVVQGQNNTLGVTMQDMLYHTRLVSQNVSQALVIGDMPFLSYTNTEEAIYHAGQLIKEGGADMVKLEGGASQIGIVEALSRQNIAVCAHLGLQPQAIQKLGSYKVQGRDESVANTIFEDATRLEEAGAELLVLECVPSALAKRITQTLNIPTIGIGAGVDCDGQVLVSYDLLGITEGNVPKFAENYLEQVGSIDEALQQFIHDVKNRKFPAERHSFQ
jgi:3-methyl-2-oxobutanoate hydroxymethyltransferase